MKINEIIRQRRLAKNLTQEQVASFLGVSAPAVNKWEKAVTYPDITILPALARLLDTDLNTLLSFKEDLTEQEIGHFLNTLTEMSADHDMESIYNLAMDKIKEYPSCDLLILNTALILEGILTFYQNKSLPDLYSDKMEELYERAAKSDNPKINQQAKSMLISKYMSRKDYKRTEQLLEELPDEYMFHKKQLQIKLFIERGNLEEAIKMAEEKLYVEVNNIYMNLVTLMEINLKENNIPAAKEIAGKLTEMVKLFDLWEYNLYVPEFYISIAEKDSKKCIAILRNMLPSMLTHWKFTDSLLYKHMKEKKQENKQDRSIGELVLPNFIKDIENPDNHEYDFLREDTDFIPFLTEFKKTYSNILA